MQHQTAEFNKEIVLLNPPLTPQVRYGAPAAGGAVEPPYGILYLASTLRRQGFPVRILDAEALGELLAAQEAVLPLEGVKGLILRKEGEPFLTGERDYIGELDSLPLPAWDLLPAFPDRYQVSLQNARRLPAVSLITSRGCRNRCSFCDNSLFGHRVRVHSGGYVLEMIRVLTGTYGIRGIFFEDDNFMALGDRLLELCEGLIREGIELSWSCQVPLGRAGPESPEKAWA